jgi:hypothetical protein
MKTLRAWLFRIRRMLRRKQLETEMNEAMRMHLVRRGGAGS